MTDGPAGGQELRVGDQPTAAAGTAAELAELGEIVAALRLRCPWDREQTHRSLVRHLLEEAHEAIEAIDGLSEPPTAEQAEHLREELGDVLFQVYFHSLLASEEGLFDLGDVARATREKLVARHPHVFGDRVATDSKAVVAHWERGKLDEKGRTSLMDGIPAALPALAVSAKVERKAAGAGLGVEVTGQPERLPGLLEALIAGESSLATRGERPLPVEDATAVGVTDEELGELLLGIARLAAHEGHDPEAALRQALARFRARFVAAEDEARAAGSHLHEIDPAERLRMWQHC
jgi:MazG family protein